MITQEERKDIRESIKNLITHDQEKILREIEDIVNDLWKGPQIIRSFTDHGVSHSYRICNNIIQLLKIIDKEDIIEQDDYFILFASAFIHDIGMQCDLTTNIKVYKKLKEANITNVEFNKNAAEYTKEQVNELRRIHNEVTRVWVLSALKDGELVNHDINNRLAEVIKKISNLKKGLINDITDIAAYHTKYKLDEMSEEMYSNNKNNKKILSCIFRLADELDFDYTRVKDKKLQDAFSKPKYSDFIYWYHKCVSIVFGKGVVRLIANISDKHKEPFKKRLEKDIVEKNRDFTNYLADKEISIQIIVKTQSPADSEDIPEEYYEYFDMSSERSINNYNKVDNSNFLNYFDDCSSNNISSKYCKKFDYYPKKLSKNKNLSLINDCYDFCFNLKPIRLNYNKKSTNFFTDSNKPIASNIKKKFYEEYIYPDMKRSIFERPEGKTFIKSEKFKQELEDEINIGNYNIIFISGNIGDGKSTLLEKFIFDTWDKYNHYYREVFSDDDISTFNKKFSRNNKKNIVYIDNLDSFSFSKERFMFVEDGEELGYNGFKEGIEKVQNIVHTETQNMDDNNIDVLIIAVRPYVLSHFFHIGSDGELNGRAAIFAGRSLIYTINRKEDISESIVVDRVFLFQEVIKEYLSKSKNKDKDIEKYLNDFLEQFDSMMYEAYKHDRLFKDDKLIENYGRERKKFPSIKRFYNISTQGYRTLMDVYHKLKYNPEIFNKLFTNNILLIYKMGLYKKYCQILPAILNNKQCNKTIKYGSSGKRYNYPNMFLSVSNTEVNDIVSCNSTYLTYWLKIFILEYINNECKKEQSKFIPVEKVINYFSKEGKYDNTLVKIALGSLGTINEYNCIEYRFPTAESRNLEEFISTTSVGLTARGQYFVNEKTYFKFNDIELFIDDWQLPMPSISKEKSFSIKLDNELKLELEKLLAQDYNYSYLFYENPKDMTNLVVDKAKLSIWFIMIVSSCYYKEIDFYNVDLSHKYNREFFKKIIFNIIKDANEILSQDTNSDAYTNNGEIVKNELTDFYEKCKNNANEIDNFFNNVFKNKVKIDCRKKCKI